VGKGHKKKKKRMKAQIEVGSWGQGEKNPGDPKIDDGEGKKKRDDRGKREDQKKNKMEKIPRKEGTTSWEIKKTGEGFRKGVRGRKDLGKKTEKRVVIKKKKKGPGGIWGKERDGGENGLRKKGKGWQYTHGVRGLWNGKRKDPQ